MRTYTSADLCGWLDAVGNLAAAVASMTPLPELFGLIATTACDLTGYEGCGLLLADEQEQLLFVGSAGLSDEYLEEVNVRHTITLTTGPLAGGPSSRAFLTAEPVIVRDVLADSTFAPWAQLLHEHGYRALVSIPLLVDDKPAGTLNCYRTSVHDFGAEEIALLWTLAHQAGTALQSSRLITSLTEERQFSQRSESIHRELTAVAARSGGVEGVADALARLQHQPVLVTDANGTVVANVASDGVQLAPEPLPSGLSPHMLAESGHRVTMPVCLGGEVVARVWMPGRVAELAPLDVRALEHAAVVCALEFLRYRTALDVEWSLRADLLSDVLAGVALDRLGSRASMLGHDPTRAHTVLVTALDGTAEVRQSAARQLLSVVRATAAQCEPRPLVTPVDDDVVVLWPNDLGSGGPVGDAADQIRRGIVRASGDTASVVIGHRCDHLDDARAAVGTARAALQLARLHGADRVVTLPDLGVYGLLLQLNDPRELVGFAERTLAPLREHDAARNGQLLVTVRTYLGNGMSITRTAKKLFVHQNTVGLRLKKIEELTRISLQEPESWLQLKVALMADEVLGTAG